MVYRRRTTAFRKRPYRKRPTFRRKKIMRVPRRRFNNDVHSYKQHCELSNITVVAGTVCQFQYSFKLNDLAAITQFDFLYDHYRINAVKLTFTPEYNTYVAGLATNNVIPIIYLVTDYDSQVPLSPGALDQYTHVKQKQFNRRVTHYLKPRNLSLVWSGTVGTNAYSMAPKSWIDMASPQVPYYGVLGAITTSDITHLPAMLVRVTATYYFQCKGVR